MGSQLQTATIGINLKIVQHAKNLVYSIIMLFILQKYKHKDFYELEFLNKVDMKISLNHITLNLRVYQNGVIIKELKGNAFPNIIKSLLTINHN